MRKRNSVILFFAILCMCTCFLAGCSNRSTYTTEAEMREALQGKYYLGNSKIIIYGDTAVTITARDRDWSNDIEWNYKKGSLRTFKEYIVTSDGNLKDDDGNIYKKDQYVSTSNQTLRITKKEVVTTPLGTFCIGTLKNTGNKTCTNIEMIGVFMDSKKNILDLDWDCVVGPEGLAPNESVTFTLVINRDERAISCNASIFDFDN